MRERGTTLIELLVTMGVLSILLVILTTVFTASVDVQNQSRGYSAVMSDGRFTLMRLAYDIRRASAVTTPSIVGESGQSLTITIDGVDHTYSVSNDAVQMTVGGVTDKLTSPGVRVTDASFQLLRGASGISSVRYSMTLTATGDPQNPLTQTYASTTELRHD